MDKIMPTKDLYYPGTFDLLERASLVVNYEDEKTILLVEINTRGFDPDIKSHILDLLLQADGKIPWYMFIDRENIEIFEWNKSTPILTFKTSDIFKYYDDDFKSSEILPSFLKALVRAWLMDLDSNWKLEKPPGMLDIHRIGLLEKLNSTRIEEDFA